VVPIMDVDGTRAQKEWLSEYSEQLNVLAYLEHRLRRLPGEDREFAWPGAPWGGTVLPECQAADTFLNEQGPAIAHMTLHGMGIAHGAWFLLDQLALQDGALWQDLRTIATDAGLDLHDGPRFGDKGFRRCAPGFCTTPSGSAMRRWAVRENKDFAKHFAYSSMDAARARARRSGVSEINLPLCAVSEFPLLALPMQNDNAWREELAAVPLAENAATMLSTFNEQYQLQNVPLPTQVNSMLQMVQAVCAAALRRCG
ncbi:MAG: hypothetical protein HRU15_04280, partial [Planctomycetes bacterium]|nr:hypothetical protein [Planctomycetota bacterium]